MMVWITRSDRVKLKQEKSDKDLYNEEREKRFMKKNEFFSRHIDHEIEIELEKNLRIAFIDGFCSISPKVISLRRNKTHENAL